MLVAPNSPREAGSKGLSGAEGTARLGTALTSGELCWAVLP